MAVTDILKGPVTVWYAPVGEAEPADSVAYGADLGGNWEQVGRTKESLKQIYDRATHMSRSQQDILPLNETATEGTLGLETMLQEITATNLQLVMGGTATTTAPGVGQVGKDELEGGEEFDLDERAWCFEGRYVNAAGAVFPVRYFIRRGTSKINGNLEWAKEADVGIPLRVNALAVGDGSTKPWMFQRVTAAATG